jgi:hypothetical protein
MNFHSTWNEHHAIQDHPTQCSSQVGGNKLCFLLGRSQI